MEPVAAEGNAFPDQLPAIADEDVCTTAPLAARVIAFVRTNVPVVGFISFRLRLEFLQGLLV